MKLNPERTVQGHSYCDASLVEEPGMRHLLRKALFVNIPLLQQIYSCTIFTVLKRSTTKFKRHKDLPWETVIHLTLQQHNHLQQSWEQQRKV